MNKLVRADTVSFGRTTDLSRLSDSERAAFENHLKDVESGAVEVWINDVYQVELRRMEPTSATVPPMVWLSIKRRDRSVIRDWRHLQQIKNELVGEECEAVELFPAESRLVDTSNQFHLWAIDDPTFRFGFGFKERKVEGPEEASKFGAVQRGFK